MDSGSANADPKENITYPLTQVVLTDLMIDLTFNQVSKKYRIYREPVAAASGPAALRKVQRLWNGWQDFWALRDVSFEVERGEALGIIGQNGAGKSTILKLLYNITTPTKGEIKINGRLAALIEVASGFHPELTGRENVYLNGALLGMKRREIAAKIDSIVDFAGVAAFIDTPVKRYSSGMYLRLGFAIAAHLDPDILLLDEVLAVGDADFQAKCIARINELRNNGTTIVFVSHNLSAVESLCDRVFLMRQGEMYKSGSARQVISDYEQMLTTMPASAPTHLTTISDSGEAEIVSVSFLNSAGVKTTMFHAGDPVRMEVQYIAHTTLQDVAIEVYFYSVFGNLHCHFSTSNDEARLDLEPGRGIIEFFCPEMGLEVAAFNVEASVKRRAAGFSEHIDHKHVAVINIGKGKPIHGMFHLPHTWRRRETAHEDLIDLVAAEDK
ncbi:MAG: ABC transporter ATP-binding protein [Acidobacteriota bacterium]|nr:ABC transporter ATP-binding protein [Acidobacteriota bacterium]